MFNIMQVTRLTGMQPHTICNLFKFKSDFSFYDLVKIGLIANTVSKNEKDLLCCIESNKLEFGYEPDSLNFYTKTNLTIVAIDFVSKLNLTNDYIELKTTAMKSFGDRLAFNKKGVAKALKLGVNFLNTGGFFEIDAVADRYDATMVLFDYWQSLDKAKVCAKWGVTRKQLDDALEYYRQVL